MTLMLRQLEPADGDTAATEEEIVLEHFLGEDLRQNDLDRFQRQGVAPLALVGSAIILRHRVVFQNDRFEFERHRGPEDALTAFVVPAWNEFGDLADLVAWRPSVGLGTWLGRVGMLGEEQALIPRLEPLRVHATVMHWLRAHRDGVVIIDPVRAGSLLRHAGPLLVSSVEHGQRLRKVLAAPAPEMLVDVAERAA